MAEGDTGDSLGMTAEDDQTIKLVLEVCLLVSVLFVCLMCICTGSTRSAPVPIVRRRRTREWARDKGARVCMRPPGAEEEPDLLEPMRNAARNAGRMVTQMRSPLTQQRREDDDDDHHEGDESESSDDEAVGTGYTYSNVVRCPSGHPMNAKVMRELLGAIPCKPKNACRGWANTCADCQEQISIDASRYRCRGCRITYCASCCREHLGLPTVRGSGEGNSCLDVGTGDILLIGPDFVGIHHVVLVTGDLRREHPDVGWVLDLEPGIEVWSCDTIESVQSACGNDWWWYPARSYFGRDPYKLTVRLVADMPQRSGEIEAIEPVPLKILLHPMRREFGGPGIDGALWAAAVEDGAEHSKKYSYVTRFTMAVAYLLQQTHLQNAALDAKRFPTQEARSQLLKAITASWERPPICSTVAIQTWQRYLVDAFDDDNAAQAILEYMPLFCHTTLPATLAKELTKYGWVMKENFEV